MDKLKKVTSIKLKLGDLKMVTKESFTEAFKELSKGTICEKAKLDIKETSGDILVVEKIEGEFRGRNVYGDN
jgi:Zn finger protein HypA/HybF involved in hydrogenase expression